MTRMRRLVVVVVPLLAALLLAPVAWGQEDMTPSIEVSEQEIENGRVVLDRVVMDGPGWVVIHIQENGQPGAVIGHAAVSEGENMDVSVEIDVSQATETLYAMLHDDTGEEGTYEFGQDDLDPPLERDGEIVLESFTITGGLEEDMEEEEEEEATATPMVEEEEEDEDEAVLPETGASAGGASVAAVALVVGGVVAMALGILIRKMRGVRRARIDDSD